MTVYILLSTENLINHRSNTSFFTSSILLKSQLIGDLSINFVQLAKLDK
ncbi:hypothetical protein HOF65_08035 [bacterium]|nr:hypothetical protein [bacterium]MBT3853841.1 hypothetical protein [bacterium]MBT4632856.1 hypothetical protein [bacterium]MBT6779235.1 hypothetical protein [bacterium]